MVKSCGIDFGTTNSAIAIASSVQIPKLICLEGKSLTMPSTIFYSKSSPHPLFGSEAIDNYTNGNTGRFMRSLKRVLGTDLMSSGTIVNGKLLTFSQVLQGFISNLKSKAEQEAKEDIEHVVMGRPVHFRNNDINGDNKAQQELEIIAKKIGFKYINFQFEPIAAAFAHEDKVEGEKLACVVDIGGGTSDFSIIKIGKSLQNKLNRQDDILANSGTRIGGNDFDKNLSIACFMPEFGLGTMHGEKNLPVPSSTYFDLAEWSKINSLYNYSTLKLVKNVLDEAHNPEKYARLFDIIENETGHMLLALVEKAKINLTYKKEFTTQIEFIKQTPSIKTSTKEFNESIINNVQSIISSLQDCLTQANICADKIELVILTGGSTEIPLVQQTIKEFFPKAQISQENKMDSVGLGLAFDSRRLFS